MAKIVTPGILKPSIPDHLFRCTTCGCVFQSQEDEVTIHNIPDVQGMTWLKVRCPDCGNTFSAYFKIVNQAIYWK